MTLSIVIRPPWWQTTWAYLLYGLLFIGGVFVVDRVQRKRLIRQERQRTQERELAQAREIEKAHTELQETHTELEQSHQHLKTTQAQLVQQEKMASLGQLTAGIAHEIKNPLNLVNNFAEVNEEIARDLIEELAHNSDSETLEDLAHSLKTNAVQIAKHGKRADRIVQSMMEHATQGTGERYDVGVNRLVDEYVNLSYHAVQAQVKDLKVDIKRDYDEAVGSVEMTPQEIGRALMNVLNNAFYAVHEKAQTLGGGPHPTVSISTKQVDGQVEIRVSDNGPGIPPEIQDRIFEPFFTTKPTGTGTGLGLSLSYDIVTQGHGGTLRVESTEGEGATFVITLPMNSPNTG